MMQNVNQSPGFNTGICGPMGDFAMTPYIYIRAMRGRVENMLINSFRLLEKKEEKKASNSSVDSDSYFVLPPLQPLTLPCSGRGHGVTAAVTFRTDGRT